MKNLIDPFSKRKNKKVKNFSSLSSDYFIYAGFILAITIFSSIYSAIKLYNAQQNNLNNKLESQAQLIDTHISDYIKYVSHIVEDKGYKIALTEGNLKNIEYIFKRNFFFPVTKSGLKKKAFIWPHFSWIDNQRNILAKSEYGILQSPIKIDNSQHLYLSTVDHWQLHLSDPYQNPISEKVFIDATLGVADIENEKYIGSIATKFNIKKIINNINSGIDNNIEYLILSEDFKSIIDSKASLTTSDFFAHKLIDIVTTNTNSIFTQPIEFQNNTYKLYKKSEQYPFIILTGYNAELTNKQFLTNIFKRIFELFSASFLVLAILFLQRQRIIRPINKLANIARKIASGTRDSEITQNLEDKTKKVPLEIHELREALLLTKRTVEQEVKHKKLAQQNSLKLSQINEALEHQNESVKKSKKSHEQFLSEVQNEVIEDAIKKIVIDTTKILDNEQNDIIITKQARNEFYKNLLKSCSKILFYVSDDLKPSYCDIKKLIEESVEINRYNAQINRVELNIKISQNIGDIYVDHRSIKHALASLINYAMEDRKRGKKPFVQINAKNRKTKEQKFLEIILKDNGHGISEEMRKNFQETSEKQGKNKNNMLLNLEAIRHILKLHNAQLTIESIASQGSTITITIPHQKPENKQSKTTSKNATKSHENNKSFSSNKVIKLFPQKK